MKPCLFNARMPSVNELYLARILDMQLNGRNRGIDIIGERARIEVKFRLNKYNHTHWTVENRAMAYPDQSPKTPHYWALGYYELDREIKDIPERWKSLQILEQLVKRRETYIVPWTWMEQFPVHEVTGETKKSIWRNYFRYARAEKMPPKAKEFRVPKGVVHITEGVNLEDLPGLKKYELT
jgi:hypothetical protein